MTIEKASQPIVIQLCDPNQMTPIELDGIVTVGIHDFSPCDDEVVHKLLFVIVLCINLNTCPKDPVRTKDKISVRSRIVLSCDIQGQNPPESPL